jgi:hypothetical protein
MRKILLLCATLIFSFLFLLSASAHALTTVSKILHDNTVVYAQADFASATDTTLPQNHVVVLAGEPFEDAQGILWQRIEYGGGYRWVLSANIYKTVLDDYKSHYMKALAPRMGQRISLYSTADTQSHVLAQVPDGTHLRIIESSIDYGGFYKAEYDGKIVFVEKIHVTTGLSYNQKFTAILAAVTAGILAAGLLTVRFLKKKKAIR